MALPSTRVRRTAVDPSHPGRRPRERGGRPALAASRLVRAGAAGLVLGAGLGVLARLWMRTVSTDPSFSWTGTLMIVGLFAGAGLLLGVVRALRLAGRSSWWKLLLVPCLALFGGPGMLLLPGSLVGGWALAGRGPRVLRVAGLVLTLVVLPLVLWFVLSTPAERRVLQPAVVLGGLGVVQGLLAWGFSEVFRTHRPRPVVSGLEPATDPGPGVVQGSR